MFGLIDQIVHTLRIHERLVGGPIEAPLHLPVIEHEAQVHEAFDIALRFHLVQVDRFPKFGIDFLESIHDGHLPLGLAHRLQRGQVLSFLGLVLKVFLVHFIRTVQFMTARACFHTQIFISCCLTRPIGPQLAVL